MKKKEIRGKYMEKSGIFAYTHARKTVVRKEREAVAEDLLKRRVEAAGGLCLKFGTNGMPDRIVILRGRVTFIELKRPGGVPRPDQLYCIDKLQRAGADVRALAGSDEVRRWCDEQDI